MSEEQHIKNAAQSNGGWSYNDHFGKISQGGKAGKVTTALAVVFGRFSGGSTGEERFLVILIALAVVLTILVVEPGQTHFKTHFQT